jgi:hypothetical protein
MVAYALSFLDVKHLLQMERVNNTWWQLCRKTIYDKSGPSGPQAFHSNEEISDAVSRYCWCDAKVMEEIACTNGYPIDKWNVSQVENMSRVFMYWNRFNEPIGSWDECSLFGLEVPKRDGKEWY